MGTHSEEECFQTLQRKSILKTKKPNCDTSPDIIPHHDNGENQGIFKNNSATMKLVKNWFGSENPVAYEVNKMDHIPAYVLRFLGESKCDSNV